MLPDEFRCRGTGRLKGVSEEEQKAGGGSGRAVIREFQEKHPTKESKERALEAMSDEEIGRLINATSNVQAKIFYSRFKKGKD